MNLIKEKIELLCDPITKENLVFADGRLISENAEYEIKNDIPILLSEDDLRQNEYAINIFKREAPVYDENKHLTFDTFKTDENTVRESLINRIPFRSNMRVLELSAGTGRDSVLIQKRMTNDSKLHVQDISMDMLLELKKKFRDDEVFITCSNAVRLPYKSNVFDAIYSFGGVGMGAYRDTAEVMKEIARVAKVGAKVVIGNLGIGPWLYDSEFGKILINHNAHYAQQVDLRGLPIEARNVKLEWILNGGGMVLEFDIGEGEPDADFDFPIPGKRGGTLRTRYYGKLEGVNPEVKELAYKAVDKTGMSMYDFMNTAIKNAADKLLDQK